MAAIVIKDVPSKIHRLLKQTAQRNRRSMSQEVIHILEHNLRALPPLKLVKPVVPKRPFSHEWLLKAMKAGRA